jgi:hypothetical protein
VRDDDDEVDELCILRIQNFDEQQFPLWFERDEFETSMFALLNDW